MADRNTLQADALKLVARKLQSSLAEAAFSSHRVQAQSKLSDEQERLYVLRLAELPGWLRTTLGWLYLVWALVVTAFAAYVVIRSLDFDGEVEPTIETIALLAGLLVAPLLPFAQRLFSLVAAELTSMSRRRARRG